MANPIPSLFLGNVEWKLVKQYKNSDFYINIHIATATVNLFEMLEMIPGICLTCAIKCLPSNVVWPIQFHHYF